MPVSAEPDRREKRLLMRYARSMNRLFALALLLAAWPALAGVIVGRVIEIPDGGTVTVLAKEGASIHRVRLAGIRAPGRERAYGANSRESLRRLTLGKTVRVETSAIDGKGLLIGVVSIVRGAQDCATKPCAPLLDPGLSQLSSGWAALDNASLARHPESAQAQYGVAQAQAKAARTGLWRDPHFRARAVMPR